MPQNNNEETAPSEFYKGIVDITIAHLFESFHEISLNDALIALDILSHQTMIGNTETDYAELPEVLRSKPYEKIQESLRELHLIMQNRQPEEAPKFDGDQGPEVNFGVFGLTNRTDVTSKTVRDYLVYKFQVKMWTLKILHSIVAPMLVIWKRKLRAEFIITMVEWIKNESNGMPNLMKEMIKSKGILHARIILTIKKDDPSIKDSDRELISHDIMDDIFKLSPSIIDSDTNLLESIFLIPSINDKNEESKLQRNALRKLKEHMQNPKFTDILQVCQSFVPVEKAYRILCGNNALVKCVAEIKHVDEVEKNCTEYLNNIAIAEPETLKELPAEILQKIICFNDDFDAFLSDAKVNYIVNFFASYFQSENDEKNILYKSLMELHFQQNKIFVEDSLILKIWEDADKLALPNPNENDNGEPTPTVIYLSPYIINRLLMHACVIHPNKWTPTFAFAFETMLDLLKDKNDLNFLNKVLRRDSYPPAFIQQMEFLLGVHNERRIEIDNIPAAEQEADTYFPLLLFPRTGTDICNLFCFLKLEHATAIFEEYHLETKLTSLDLHELGQTKPDKVMLIFNLLKDKSLLNYFFKNFNDFSNVVAFIPQQQHKDIIYQNLKEQLKTFVNDKAQQYMISCGFLYLTPQQCAELAEQFNDDLTQVWENLPRFFILFKMLDIVKRDAVYTTLLPKFHGHIHSFIDFSSAINSLSPEQCKILCSSLNDKIPIFMTNFMGLLIMLDIEKFSAVCNGLDLLTIFQNSFWKDKMVYMLKPEKFAIFNARLMELMTEQEPKNKRTHIETTGMFASSNVDSNKRQKSSEENFLSPRP